MFKDDKENYEPSLFGGPVRSKTSFKTTTKHERKLCAKPSSLVCASPMREREHVDRLQSPLDGAAVKTKKNNKSKFVLFLTL